MKPLLARGTLMGLDDISDVGKDQARGGFSRHVWDDAELELREWFVARAKVIGLEVTTDRNGNMWAWWGRPGDGAIVTGSHLDSVPGGGAFDGPLGVASALDAVAILKSEGFRPTKPFAVVVFAEEEGGRFGVACMGSRLMTGQLNPARARALRDSDGVSFEEAARRAGFDPSEIGADTDAVARIGLFVELHVEQGRGLIDLDSPIGLASTILAHGRWRVKISGQGNHAGTTPMDGRSDPMVAAAESILEIRDAARLVEGARATVGKIRAVPGGANVIASSTEFWLDARADTDDATRLLVSDIRARLADVIDRGRCSIDVVEESWSGQTTFDPVLRARLQAALGSVPVLPTGAGHDAGVLAAHVPTAMLFVRNPTGISHSPEEHAEAEDCLKGVEALATVLRGLL